jgi:hypothetical protein
MATTTKKPTVAKLDPLDMLAADPNRLLGLLLWQRRIDRPELSTAITKKDIDGMAQGVEYVAGEADGVEVRAFRRGDRVLVQLVDAKSKAVVRRQVMGKDKEGRDIMVAKDLDVEVRDGRPVMQPGDEIVSIGDAIRPIENNQEDFDASERAERLRVARASAPDLAAMVKQSALMGTFSKELVVEACDKLVLLASAK